MLYIVANWKCNPSSAKTAVTLFNAYAAAKINSKIHLIVCPPFCYCQLAQDTLKKTAAIGAQNCCWEGGAYTGELSPHHLAEMGCKYVIIGHSERRRYFGETNESANKKIKAVLAVGLTPILCIGETQKEYLGEKTIQIIETQLKECLLDIDLSKNKILIAYEPIWAIGSGQACEAAQADQVRQFIADFIDRKAPVLYGGSVSAENIESYFNKGKFDGLLIGGLSLKPDEFIQAIKF